MEDNKKLTIIFDNSSSAHKEGFVEDISYRSDLLIIHLRKNIFFSHPSENMNKDSEFNKFRYQFSLDNSVKKIVHHIQMKLMNIIKEKKEIEFIYSFLDFKRLKIIYELSKKLKDNGKNIKFLPYFEPIRVNDIKTPIRLLKFIFSFIIQKIYLKPKKILLISSLNMFIYKLFFKSLEIYPYCQSRAYIQQCKDIKIKKSGLRFKILYIGQLIKRKNVDLILKACSKLHFKSELSIYGEGYEKNKLIKIANTLMPNSNSKFIFHGFVNNDMLKKTIGSYDVLVLPSRFDGFGFVVAEANYLDVYSIVSSQVGAKDILNSKTGAIFKVGSLPELINHLNLHFIRSGFPNES